MMDGLPQLASASDLEVRAARIADPAAPLKLKHDVAQELRDMVDSVRDMEASRTFPHMLTVLFDTLRNTEPSFKRDSLEFQFRRALVEIIHRIPPSETMRPQLNNIVAGILGILKNDTEDNAVTSLKAFHDLLRVMKQISDEQAVELLQIFLQMLRSVPSLVAEFLSENSPPTDANSVVTSNRSLKVITEMPFVLIFLFQTPSRAALLPLLPELIGAALEAGSVESPIQKAARENYEAMGGIWAGQAPNMKNPKLYENLVAAQIKLMNFCSYIFRSNHEALGRDPRGEAISVQCVRILQDCPNYLTNARRELISVLRHQMVTPFRRAFVPIFEKLLSERIILGSPAAPVDTSRFGPFFTVFELSAGLRSEFSTTQVTHIINVYSRWLLNAPMNAQAQSVCARMLTGMIEPAVTKSPSEEMAGLTMIALQAVVEKMKALDLTFKEVNTRIKKQKEGSDEDSQLDISYIEKERPLLPSNTKNESSEGISADLRYLFRTLLHACRVSITILKKLGATLPDGEIVIPVFEHSIGILLSIESADFKEERDSMDLLAIILQDINLHVFQELWTQRLEFYFRACVKKPSLLHLSQVLFQQKTVSQTVVSTTLRHLSDGLNELGEYDDVTASTVLRFFKMTFSVVGIHPDANEPVLATHLGRLIMDSFPLAAKATRPLYYFHLMRALFRAIGSGGGRYEQLYKEVLPLLPEMLDCLNRQLMAADAQTRDLLVELCLTVPLRLTHLLPHLHYLMKPLVLALQGGSELVSQGLRTLELCIDNLIGDFLDPILRPVLRELMEALHSHLKPLPGNHHHAHTTIRILGKLGGRNRRLLDEKPNLVYKPYSDPATITVSFSGRQEAVRLGPVAGLSARLLAKTNTTDRIHAYNYLEHTLTYLLNEGLTGSDRESIFVEGVKGLFDAIHVPEVQDRAQEYLRTLSRHVFTLEARKALSKDVTSRRFPSHMFGLYLDAFPLALARSDEKEAQKAAEVVKSIVHDLVPIGYTNGLKHLDILPILHMVATRFSTFCFEDAWVRKSAGVAGIMIMSSTPEIGDKWLFAREIDIVRTLLHVLKDSPHDPPRNVNGIIEDLEKILRMTNTKRPNQMEVDGQPPAQANRIPFLIGIFFNDITSPHPVVRKTAQSCIKLLSDLCGKPIGELLMPHRDRVMTSIFVKPLRSLPHPIIIGQVEAVRYCISLETSLLEVNDELIRLLHEALALADNSDQALIAKTDIRKSTREVTQLRVACLNLLTAALPLTDCFSRVPTTRQKVTSVYFKSLYNSSRDVADAAHAGLRIVLGDQSRFQKDLLQSGLRPILMNLSDTRKLTIQDLEGLSRLLRLLANYFKVEIGIKLLDHFRAIADPQMLQASARTPLSENDSINKLVSLINVFHLLPATAIMYLKDLIDAVVQTEARLFSCAKSPFSEPLGKYVDRYAPDAMDYFLKNMSSPRHVRTLRNLLNAGTAPMLLRELSARSWDIARVCFLSGNADTILPGLLVCEDLANLVQGWTKGNDIIDTVLGLWKLEPEHPPDWAPLSQPTYHKHSSMISIFRKALQESPRIDILFDIVSAYSMDVVTDLGDLTHFLYEHVALHGSFAFRRNILLRFLVWFDDPSVSYSRKMYCLRYIISPLISVHASRASEDSIVDRSIIERLHTKIWKAGDTDAFSDADDLFKVEILHLTTVLLHKCPQLLVSAKKDIIKFGWPYISSDDQTVRQMAYLLTARFFAAFDSPPKFIMRTWTGLLQPPHVDGNRALTQQTLDILAPVLQKMPNDPSMPHWARTTRRLLAEESNGNLHVIMIYQLIARQPDLFYSCRALFIPHIINSLQRLGFQMNANNEGRILALDVLEVIYKWEKKSADSGDESGWITPLVFREGVISYLTRAACGPQDVVTRTTVVARSLSLLKDLLRLPAWASVNFKLDYFRKSLCEVEFTQETAPVIVANARVLSVVCADRPDEWFIQNVKALQKLVQKGMLLDEVVLHETLHPIVDRILKLYPLPKEDEEDNTDAAEFHTFVQNAISEGLKSMTGLRGALLMLKSVVEVVPERIEPFAAALMRLLGKLAKEHIGLLPGAENYDAIVRMLISILKICQNSSQLPPEQRKLHLGNLIILVEKSSSPILCQFLLDTGRDWALHRRDAYPTMKEKASLLQKMASFESRGTDLFNQYLELIYDIYTEPTLRRSDLTSRLEQAFLLGCRSHDTSLRERFVDLLDTSIPRSLMSRMTYILGSQTWEALADHNWIYLALDLLLSSVDSEMPLASSPSVVFTQTSSPLALTLANSTIRDVIRPMRRLLFYDAESAHETWVSVFSSIWSLLSRKEQGEVTQHMIILLSREHHIRQCEARPNVVQALLEGIHACSPPMNLPAHLLKYLAKTFGAWHVALEHLQKSLESTRDDDGVGLDSVYDALAEVYAELAEEDMFYGLWRRRSLHNETNVAVTYEQNGMWPEAQISYEQAMIKARNGIVPFTESEFCLWEDHWIIATEKMQQWDILYELARNDGNNELLLEAAWRNKDWADKDSLQVIEEQVQGMSDVATPRRRVFEAFIALVKSPGAVDRNIEFTRILEDAMQLSLRKWIAFPPKMSACHIPLLQHFQQFVELQEAVQIFGSLATTTTVNLEKKSADLKLVLQAWRERLPNLHDDISVWSDLVAWRQNVFSSINKHYIPLIQSNSQNGGQASAANTYGYRGYHETAWIINRFAHVARKHDLFDVAQQSLTRIYELPNIEISEAFLKLREEARCRLQVPERMVDGLNLINNTNLVYFSTPQKAEFYTLKGMFYSALNDNDEAENCFSQAVSMDMNVAKAWAEWGRFNDKMFNANFTNVGSDAKHGAHAVSCYLQAAGLYKNAKSRPLLTRVLWLLSVDDASSNIARAYDTYSGDKALWYWITLIPQLLFSLSYAEAPQAQGILIDLAKAYPQALFFPLRSLREEMQQIRKAAQQKAAAQAAQNASHGDQNASNSDIAIDGASNAAGRPAGEGSRKEDWMLVEEVAALLKTNNPLLALTLETMVDQFIMKFKSTPEEEIYRFTFMLLQDAVQNASSRARDPNDDGRLSEHNQRNIAKMAIHLAGPARKDYEDEFVHSKPLMGEYITKLQQWRDRYETFLDARPRMQPLDLISHWLIEFQYAKFDEVEVPGQYLELTDGPQQFSRIRQFGSKFEMSRGQGFCFKRFVIHGHDGMKYNFAVQQPAARWIRREERVMQLFRTFNHALTRRKESRKRNLQFHLPWAVSLSPSVRLITNDSSYVSLQDIYDRHCKDMGITREEPAILVSHKTKQIARELGRPPTPTELNSLRKAVMDEVCRKMVPEDILSRYMTRTMCGPQELWRMRKTFTLQLAAVSFMTYVVCITQRHPSRFQISRSTGQIFMSELLSGVNSQTCLITQSEAVFFRFTPNLQNFVNPVGTEALFCPGIVAIARALTKPEYELDQHLCLFIRDEVLTHSNIKGKRDTNQEAMFRARVTDNINGIVSRAETMGCKIEKNQDPKDDKVTQSMQSAANLISNCTNPTRLANMSDAYQPWY